MPSTPSKSETLPVPRSRWAQKCSKGCGERPRREADIDLHPALFPHCKRFTLLLLRNKGKMLAVLEHFYGDDFNSKLDLPTVGSLPSASFTEAGCNKLNLACKKQALRFRLGSSGRLAGLFGRGKRTLPSRSNIHKHTTVVRARKQQARFAHARGQTPARGRTSSSANRHVTRTTR